MNDFEIPQGHDAFRRVQHLKAIVGREPTSSGSTVSIVGSSVAILPFGLIGEWLEAHCDKSVSAPPLPRLGDPTPVRVLNGPQNSANETPLCQLTSLYQPTMSSKLPTNFRKVSCCENRFSALLGMAF